MVGPAGGIPCQAATVAESEKLASSSSLTQSHTLEAMGFQTVGRWSPTTHPPPVPEGEQDPTPPSYLPRSTEASRGMAGPERVELVNWTWMRSLAKSGQGPWHEPVSWLGTLAFLSPT